MNLEMLCGAVQETRPWMDDFRRESYAGALRAYLNRFGSVYLEAVREAGETGLPALAEAILDGVEAGWKRRRPWNRGTARVEERQMAAVYLTPMLLELEEPGCRRLCALIRDGWAARWPKESYQTAGFSEISGGFRNTFMGIPLPEVRRKAQGQFGGGDVEDPR